MWNSTFLLQIPGVITARVRSTTGGYVYLLTRREGVPQSLVPGPSQGGYLLVLLLVLSKVLSQVLPGQDGGIPSDRMGYSPGQDRALVDLGGASNVCRPGPKFLHFHVVFGENWPNDRFAPPGKYCIRHCRGYPRTGQGVLHLHPPPPGQESECSNDYSKGSDCFYQNSKMMRK